MAGRSAVKVGGLLGTLIGVTAVACVAARSRKDFRSYTGWENNYEGGSQFFDRRRFEIDGPAYPALGATRRIDQRVESVMERNRTLAALMSAGPSHDPRPGDSLPAWRKEDGIDRFPEHLASFYRANPRKLEKDLHRLETLLPRQREKKKKYDGRYAIAMAYSAANSSTFPYPPEPNRPPEEWDYLGLRKEALLFKSKAHAAALVKKMAHAFGATLVGITRLNPDYVYAYNLRGAAPGSYEVPSHWKYAIAIGIPMEWDSFYANPTYGTSSDAYSRVRMAAFRLQSFIRELGYPSRMHVPPRSYDLVLPPIAIDAGLGQHGRMGVLVTPETGPNIRLGVVTTDLAMAVDKPIDFGLARFCKHCRVCAEACPSRAISFDDEPTQIVRGYKRWVANTEACYGFWSTKVGTGGCRLCLAVCPYARKNSWLHRLGRAAAISSDPTGLLDEALIRIQRSFYGAPKRSEYYPPPTGSSASYRPAPDWMEVERWLDTSVS